MPHFLGKSILDVVCNKLPSPCQLTPERVESLISNQRAFSSLPGETQNLKAAFLNCSADTSVPVIAFVSKMFVVEPANISQQSARTFHSQALSMEEITAKRERVRQLAAGLIAPTDAVKCEKIQEEGIAVEPKVDENEKSGIFIAFTRIYSGILKPGDELYVLGPKHNPDVVLHRRDEDGQNQILPPHVSRAKIGDLYMMMGREMQRIPEAKAGMVVGKYRNV